MKYAVIATLGFDERPVLRSLSSIGFRDVESIVLIKPSRSDPRASKAVSEIKRIATLTGIGEDRVRIFEVNVSSFLYSIARIYGLLINSIERVDEAIVCLSGGLRILVIETYTALLMLPDKHRFKTIIRIDIEGSDESLVFKGSDLITSIELKPIEHKILSLINEEPGLNLTMIAHRIDKPVSTTWRILKRMINENLLNKQRSRYYLSSKGSTILKLHNLLYSDH